MAQTSRQPGSSEQFISHLHRSILILVRLHTERGGGGCGSTRCRGRGLAGRTGEGEGEDRRRSGAAALHGGGAAEACSPLASLLRGSERPGSRNKRATFGKAGKQSNYGGGAFYMTAPSPSPSLRPTVQPRLATANSRLGTAVCRTG